MLERFARAVRSFMNRRSAGPRGPARIIERMLRELNETVPPRAEAAAGIRERMREIEAECDEIRARDGVSDASLRRAEEQLAAARVSHAEAVASLNAFIDVRKRRILEALASLKERERAEWQQRFDLQMDCFKEVVRRGEGAPPTDGSTRAGRTEEARRKAARIRAMTCRAADETIRASIGETADAADAILDYLVEHPASGASARAFAVYYLDAALSIVEGYLELLKRESAPGVTARLRAAESAISDMAPAFKNILGKIMERDLINLDTEIAVLKKTIRADDIE